MTHIYEVVKVSSSLFNVPDLIWQKPPFEAVDNLISLRSTLPDTDDHDAKAAIDTLLLYLLQVRCVCTCTLLSRIQE